MNENPFDKPLIVQSDRTVLMDIHSSLADEARDYLARFAELVKSPEHIHTYRLSPLSIWNACAMGISADDMVKTLKNSRMSSIWRTDTDASCWFGMAATLSFMSGTFPRLSF